MERRSRAILLAVVSLTFLIWGSAFILYHNRKGDRAISGLRAGNPKIADRIDSLVAILEQESAKDSLEKLSDVNSFFWPGPKPSSMGGGVFEYPPLGKEVGQGDLEAIMSNRRFCKLIENFRGMQSAAASKMVSHELTKAIAEYLELFDSEMRQHAPHNAAGQADPGGFGFSIGNVPEGKVVIAGARLKVLALVWCSGVLKLSGVEEQIERVTRIALKQRNDLYADEKLHPFFRAQMLQWGSLYNRQILISALISLTKDHVREASFAKDTEIEWQIHELASYRSAVTEFDLPVRSGVMKPDYSRGRMAIRVVSPITDATFELMLKKLGFTP